MRLKTCSVKNFASYSSLEFDFSSLGLALVFGPTGSGKSTLQDIPCWCLFGVTAKNGAVDEIRSWQSPGEPTTATIEVELPDGDITVTRVRGKASENDLYWTDAKDPDNKHRGKDLTETQKLLEKRLGVSADIYLTGAYFHEFSPTGAFFTAKAKDQRALFEQIAPLAFPALLADKASEHRKVAKSDLSACNLALAKIMGKLEQLTESRKDAERTARAWNREHADTIALLEAKRVNFDEEKRTKICALQTRIDSWNEAQGTSIDKTIAKIEELESKLENPADCEAAAQLAEDSARCITCGALPDSAQAILDNLREHARKNIARADKIEDLKAALSRELEVTNPFIVQRELAERSENHFAAQIDAELVKTNPLDGQTGKLDLSVADTTGKLQLTKDQCKALEARVADLTQLYDLSAQLRGELLRKAVREIEAATNRYLETYFDAELRVSFALDGDDLEVSIQKSGFDCVYRQLSKGQRQLLKLSFSVSVMQAAANAAGVHFDNISLDEALDGLDADLKVKAFGLLEELSTEHGTVLVIDHSAELQSRFSVRYRVQLEGDESALIEESET